jgi:molybdopterin-containing oxidoreductase family membrane subunit
MCLTLYLMVLLLETLPIIGGIDFVRSRWPKLSARLEHVHHYAPFLAVAGLFLSMLHQSSLGATFGVIIAKPIWYRPGLSVLFIISAVAGGISLTVLLSMLASRLNRKIKVKDELLESLALVVGWILVGYLYFRFWDAFSMTYTYEPGRTEGLALLTRGPLAFNFWLGEIIMGALIPIILLLNPRTRSLPWVRMLALAMVVGGVVAYRWDTTLAGSMVILTYTPNAIRTLYTTYVPSLIEILAGGGVIAFGMLAITIGMQYFNIIDHAEVQLEPVQEEVYALGSAD